MNAQDCAAFFMAAGKGGWTVTPLFGGATSPRLARYCLFEWGDAMSDPTPGDVDTLIKNVTPIAADCPVVFPQAPVHPQIALERRREIHRAAGGLSGLPAAPPPSPVRLAVIDNAPDSIKDPVNPTVEFGSALHWPLPPLPPNAPSPPPGEHGEVLAYQAMDIGCPEGPLKGPCPVHAETVLAMGDEGNDAKDKDGGYCGTKGELAQGILRAINDWEDDLLHGTDAEVRMVLNLSLGWEDHSKDADPKTPYIDPDNCHVATPADLSPPARAVYDALIVARCHGAAVLASAGNHTGGATPHEGLLCPAHFMVWDAPGDECEDDGLVDPAFAAFYSPGLGLEMRPPTMSDDPLVTPVGAVDFGDFPLQPPRPNSRPRLVGPGAFATSYGGAFSAVTAGSTLPFPEHIPPSLTGTSVGTLEASAVAAAVWAYAPTMAPADVLELVYSSGAQLHEPGTQAPMLAEQHRSSQPSRVSRVSLCRALNSALGQSLLCSDPEPTEGDAVPSQNSDLTQASWDLWDSAYPMGNSITPTDIPWPSTWLGTYYTESAGLDLGPTPPTVRCPNCGLDLFGSAPVLYAYPDAQTPITGLLLVKVEASGAFTTYGSGGGAPLIAGFTGAGVTLPMTGIAMSSTDRFYVQWMDANGGVAGFSQIPVLRH